MSDLQTDIEYLEQQYLDAGQPMSHETRNVLAAARLVANPNLRAAALYLGLLTDYGISGETIRALAEGTVAAALTRPGEPTDDYPGQHEGPWT